MSSLDITKWNIPTQIHFGPKQILELPKYCVDANITQPFFVIDPYFEKQPILVDILAACKEAGITPTLYPIACANPTLPDVMTATTLFEQAGCNGFIALGGGSIIDLTKAIALQYQQSESILAFEDIGDNYLKVDATQIKPIIAIPTTAGTGSEVGRAAVIIDPEQQRKIIVFHPKLLPACVILDPLLTTELPANITAATGMDALSHALEAYCVPSFHPIADGIALEAIRLVLQSIEKAVKTPNDLDARANMLVASSMGAIAFQKGLGAMHALSHSLGAIYNAHHGLLNAILMPYVLQFNQQAIGDKLEFLKKLLSHQQSINFIETVLNLRKSIGIPHTLDAIGIDNSQKSLIIQNALKDPSALGNPISLTENDIASILNNAITGNLM